VVIQPFKLSAASRQPAMKGKTQEAERMEHSAERIVIEYLINDSTLSGKDW
jgi:hypothetical protein